MFSIELVIAVALIVFGLAFLFFINWYYRYSLASSDMEDIDRMSGIMFEKFLVTLFEDLGYKVIRTPDTADFGADLIIQKDDIKTVVQAKRYKNTVNLEAVQQAVAARLHYKCQKTMVVTNNKFRKSAWTLAKSNHVWLMDRNGLRKAVLKAKKK